MIISSATRPLGLLFGKVNITTDLVPHSQCSKKCVIYSVLTGLIGIDLVSVQVSPWNLIQIQLLPGVSTIEIILRLEYRVSSWHCSLDLGPWNRCSRDRVRKPPNDPGDKLLGDLLECRFIHWRVRRWGWHIVNTFKVYYTHFHYNFYISNLKSLVQFRNLACINTLVKIWHN